MLLICKYTQAYTYVFSSFRDQIIENEVEIREIRSVLDYLDSENTQMRGELQSVQGTLSKERTDGSAPEEMSLQMKVEALEKRLDEVVRERDQANRVVEENNRHRDEELESIKKIIHFDQGKIYNAGELSNPGFSNSESVEVTIENAPAPESARDKDTDEAARGWLCDCFPSSGRNESDENQK